MLEAQTLLHCYTFYIKPHLSFITRYFEQMIIPVLALEYSVNVNSPAIIGKKI